ncbi:helix-turn-helix transcriptional regulator [Aureivirga sp. CE67]|uniref:helix-turn-helix transcriptional regulator n=1 Tax=Aureivirga sp. CE67 TaxID=1788983 RepID=UPI0018CA2E9C|nr:WYL domain-containing protein [Aureivirga sp. CE67]
MNYEIANRFRLLMERLLQENYPSKSELIEFLEKKEIYISDRTLERDLRALKSNFGIDCQYDRLHKGYFIPEEINSKQQISSLFHYLEMASSAQFFTKSINETSKTLNFIDFDKEHQFKGLEHLPIIMEAIQGQKILNFVHYNFKKEKSTDYSISPIKLKAYQNRWYVIGLPTNKKEIRVFGIDRISDLKIGNKKKINIQKYEDQLDLFNHIVGLNRQNKKIELVEVAFSKIQLEYLKSLPLHTSQKITDKTYEDKVIVEYVLAINYEFKMQLAQYGSNAVVLKPDHLKESIISDLKETLNNYGVEV